MTHPMRFCVAVGGLLSIAVASTLTAQAKPRTTEEKIANAVSAAPIEISRNATIMDWPATESGEMTVLRKGSNGWTCLPSPPQSPFNEPMCLDEPWMKWAKGYMTKTAPRIDAIGMSYMLSSKGEGSNTDPYATRKTADNQWHEVGPHLMMVVPDPKLLDAFPSDPSKPGPYVMWKGTPWAHLMIPVASTGHHGMHD